MIRYWSLDLEVAADSPEEAAAILTENLASFGGAKLHEMGYLDVTHEEEDDEDDEDRLCVCGTYESEHALCGCGEWQVVPY